MMSTANHTKVSIIIPSRNVKEDLKKCLTSLINSHNKVEFEVIVSDSNSNDGTSEMIAEHFPWVKMQASKEVGSYASSINRGIKSATGQYLLFLDSDVIVNERVVPELANFLESNPDVGAVVCKTFYPDGSLQWMIKRFPTILNSFFGRETFLTRFFPNNKISQDYLMLDKIQHTKPFEIDSASSACMMIRREILDTAGFFDEGYPFYWADIDYCRRIKDFGWKICFIPQVSVVHDMSNNADKKKSPFAIWSFHKGVYRYFRKHCTKCNFHPMNFVAWVALSGRACVLMLLNWLKSDRSA